VGEAYSYIQRGICDAVVCGGAESTITPLSIGGFNALRALSTRNDEPELASRPFDRGRNGFVMGEGSGSLVIEELEVAKARGAQIYAEIVGYGLSGDGYHMTAPDPSGSGAYRCMKMAVDDSGLPLSSFGYVNAHGTSTPLNDYTEVEAIKRVFGDHCYDLAVSSTKSSTGHLLGAAGGVEAIITALALKDGVLPPTLNFERTHDPDDPDRELSCDADMDYVPLTARQAQPEAALCNAFGFGGTNACVALARWEE
jgi:3-oxoacyl-[acyl-carrier-protein] synthase II